MGVLAVSSASVFRSIRYAVGSVALDLRHGCAFVWFTDWQQVPQGRSGYGVDPRVRWLPDLHRRLYYTVLAVPLWIVLVMVSGVTAAFWWRTRPPPVGCCQTCGYNLNGNTSGVCPECVQPIATQEWGDRLAALS